MARSALIVLCLILSGCQTTSLQNALSQAKTAEALANQSLQLPDLPDTCTAKMERATPKANEPWVIFAKRWQILADNRDKKADSCGLWWNTYKSNIDQPKGK